VEAPFEKNRSPTSPVPRVSQRGATRATKNAQVSRGESRSTRVDMRGSVIVLLENVAPWVRTVTVRSLISSETGTVHGCSQNCAQLSFGR